MTTRNRFLEKSERLTTGSYRFVAGGRRSQAQFLAGCGHTKPYMPPPKNAGDLKQQDDYLLYLGQRVAGELFQECVTVEALVRTWEVLAEASYFALGQMNQAGDMEPPGNDARSWLLQHGARIDQALVGRTTPELQGQVRDRFRERYDNAKMNRAQAQWSTKKKDESTEELKDPDSFVLDVLQFFFEERLSPAQLNDHLRRLAAYALNEAINASTALDFVPRPPSLPPTVNWLISQAVQIAFRRVRRDQGIYEVVRVTVKARLRSEYDLAKMDVGGALSIRARAMGVNSLSLSPQGQTFLQQFGPLPHEEEIRRAERTVNETAAVTLTQQQYDALVSLCLQIGPDRYAQSTLLKMLNARDQVQAAAEIRKWTKVEGKDDAELIRRRNAEAELYQSGSYSAAKSLFHSYRTFEIARGQNLSQAQNPAAIVGAVGVGWQVIKGLIDNRGDVSFNLSRMEGQKVPADDEAKYKNKAVWQEKSFNVHRGTSSVGGIWPMSATFEVKYKYNGYGVGFISMQHLKNEDAMGWGLDVQASIMVDPNNFKRDDGELMSAVDISFNYRFSTNIPFRDDDVWIGEFKVYGDGRMVVVSDKWTSPP